MMRLTPVKLPAKRQRFVDEYLIDMNGAAAAVRAGFSARSSRAIAFEILTNPDVAAVLRERQAEVARRLQIEREDVVRGLLVAVQLAREQRNPAAMVAGLREMAKVLGYYTATERRGTCAARPTRPRDHPSILSNAELAGLIDADQGRPAT